MLFFNIFYAYLLFLNLSVNLDSKIAITILSIITSQSLFKRYAAKRTTISFLSKLKAGHYTLRTKQNARTPEEVLVKHMADWTVGALLHI